MIIDTTQHFYQIQRKSFTLVLFLFVTGCTGETKSLFIKNGNFIENITVISVNNENRIKPFKGFVVTENDKVIYVGKTRPSLKGFFLTINGNGKYIIPGLIDSHVHLANIGGLNSEYRKKYPSLVKEYFEQLPKSFLYFGYTTLIDVNNYAPQLIEKIKASPIGPEIYYCGEQLQVMNDFMMEMEEVPTEERYNLSFLYDRFNTNLNIPDSIELNKHSPEALVSDIVKNQEGICIKTLYEDESSGLKKNWELPGKQIIEELVVEAHQQHVPVLMHAPSYDGQKLAHESNVDIIAHAMWNWFKNPAAFTNIQMPASHTKLLLQIASKKMGYQPTFRAIMGEVDIMGNRFTNDTLLKHVYSRAYLDWLKTDEGQWSRRKLINRAKYLKAVNPEFFNTIRSGFDSNEEMFDKLYAVLETRINKVVKLLAEHDANLLFSTDGVAMNMYTNPPGYNGFLEMKHWFKAGVSLEKIFKAATISNAKAFNLFHSYGNIETGKKANLLILDANPLNDIEAYNKIKYVVIHGKIVERSSLSIQNQFP